MFLQTANKLCWFLRLTTMPARLPIKRENPSRAYVCEVIRERIGQGIYHAGDKVSSVRELSQQLNVSIACVLDAYRSLETEGVLLGQPQSGFYVQLAATRQLTATALTKPERRPIECQSDGIVRSVLHDVQSPGMIQLATAVPDPKVLPVHVIGRTMTSLSRDRTEEAASYINVPGQRELREQIARRMLAASVAVSPDEIVITTGASEAINLCLRAVCKPGDIIAVESPTYYAMLIAAQSLGLRVVEVNTNVKEGMDCASLETVLDEYPIKAVVMTSNFSNPLGSLMPDEQKSKLVRLLADRKVSLIEDDVYGELSYTDARPIAAKAYDRQGNVLYCSSFSKTLAPGFRIGWTIPGIYQNQVELLKFATSLAAPSLQQLAIADFLAFQRYSHYIRKAGRMYQANTSKMVQVVNETFPKGTTCLRPQGGFVVWVTMPEGYDALALYEAAYRQNISFMPGPAFSATQQYRNCLRLNAATWNPQVERAVRTLGEMARQNYRIG